jgi:hypothetical protein
MAQKIQVLFIDDLDGGEAEGTVRFGLDGADYEIDLSAKNAAALRKHWPGMSISLAGRLPVPGGRAAAGAGRVTALPTPPPSACGPGPRALRSKTAGACRPGLS